MAEIRGGFFENTDYKAEDFALSHEAIITQGVVADVTEDTKDALLVLPGEDMKILVNPGYCWIKGGIGVFFGCAPATVQLSVSSADATYTRIDRVIVRKDSNNKTFLIEVLKGVASSAPEAPALTRNGTIDEICLAEITVPAGTIEITQAMIVDKRHDTSVCGISQSALNKLDTSKIFAGYEAQWAELMGQLAADPAGNLQLQIGLLPNLITQIKTNLVAAINEVKNDVNAINSAYQTELLFSGEVSRNDAYVYTFTKPVTNFDAFIMYTLNDFRYESWGTSGVIDVKTYFSEDITELNEKTGRGIWAIGDNYNGESYGVSITINPLGDTFKSKSATDGLVAVFGINYRVKGA